MKLRNRTNKKPAIIDDKSHSEDESIDLNCNLIAKAKTTRRKNNSKRSKVSNHDDDDDDDDDFKYEAKENDEDEEIIEKTSKKKPTNIKSNEKNKTERGQNECSEYFSNNDNKQSKNWRIESLDEADDEKDFNEPIKLKKKSIESNVKIKKQRTKKSKDKKSSENENQVEIKEEPKHTFKTPKKSIDLVLPAKAKNTPTSNNLDIESNIDNLLKMETQVAKKSKDSELMDDSDDEDENEDQENESDGEDAFEEVEMENTAENEMKLEKMTKGTIQVTIDPKAKKGSKSVDMAAKMERMFKTMQKKLNVTMIKTHLICWLNHGFYLNSIILNDLVRATTLSIDKFTIEKFSLSSVNKKIIVDFLTKMNKLLVKIENDDEKNEFLTKNHLITPENMIEAISSQKCLNYLQYILIVLISLRNMNIKARLCVCFDVIAMNDSREKKLNSGPKAKASNIKNSNQNSSNTTKKPTKRKSTEVGNKNKNSKKKRLNRNKKDESLSDDSEENEEPIEEDNDSSSDKNFKTKSKYFSNEKDFDEINDIKKPISKKNNKILSSDTDETNGEIPNQGKKTDTDYRNYWIEVYLEKEQTWCPIDPIEMNINNSEYFEQRFGKRILYVCAYDNDNKVKDVTKRYSDEWLTNTRLLRVGHLDDKKLWWEKTLMYHEPLDANLDIEEEKQLKKMLLEKGFPSSLSEFKDHPLYVLKKHLLKYQAIYPQDAEPAGMFRDEPIYYRDNLSTLHSRQTWLKLARVVKPFEKTYKVVKGRLKMSEYKAGMRDNPDLDLFGYWQTKQYDPPIAENGRVPRNEFGNVELFQPHMIPIGCVHLRNMPNLNRVCRKLGIDCAAAVIGFDAHGGFSHAVYDGWVICEEYKETVRAAFEEEKRNEQKRALEKREAKILNNWAHLVKLLLIRERLKKKYENKISLMNRLALNGVNSKDNEEFKNINIESIELNKVGAKLNKPEDQKMDVDQEEIEVKIYEKMPINSNKNSKTKANSKAKPTLTNKKVKGTKNGKGRGSKKRTPTPSTNSESESASSAESEDDDFKHFIKSRPSRNAKAKAMINVKKTNKKELTQIKNESEEEMEENTEPVQKEIPILKASTSTGQQVSSKLDKSDDFKLSESDSD